MEVRLGVVRHREDLGDLQARIGLLELGDCGQRALLDIDLGCSIDLDDVETRDRASVEPRKRTHLGRAIAHIGDIGKLHIGRPATQRDRQVAKLGHGQRFTDDARGGLSPADFGSPPAIVAIGALENAVDVRGGDAKRRHPNRIQRHVDFAVDAANAVDLPNALDRLQLARNPIVNEPGQVGRRHRWMRDRKRHERAAREVERLGGAFFHGLDDVAVEREGRTDGKHARSCGRTIDQLNEIAGTFAQFHRNLFDAISIAHEHHGRAAGFIANGACGYGEDAGRGAVETRFSKTAGTQSLVVRQRDTRTTKVRILVNPGGDKAHLALNNLARGEGDGRRRPFLDEGKLGVRKFGVEFDQTVTRNTEIRR